MLKKFDRRSEITEYFSKHVPIQSSVTPPDTHHSMERLLIATLVLACLTVVVMVTGYATPGWLRYRIVYEHLGGDNVEATYGFGLWRAKVCTLGVCEWYRYSATEDETAYTKGKLRWGGGGVERGGGDVRVRAVAGQGVHPGGV